MIYEFPLMVQQQTLVVSQDVDIDELLDARPGRLVRVRAINDIQSLADRREWWAPIEDEL